MHVKEIMSHPAITCPTNSTLDDVARLMWEFDCGVVPVVDDTGRACGIVTDRDISIAAYTQGKTLKEIPVATAMARAVVAVHPEDSIEHVESLMRASQVRRLPVVDSEGRPVGLVSLNDLARLSARARKSGVDRELVQTLAAVCQPRRRSDGLAIAAPITRPAVAV